MPRLELDQHVNIALGAKIVAQNGAEESQLADMMAPAELRDAISRKSYVHPSAGYSRLMLALLFRSGAAAQVAFDSSRMNRMA